MIDTDIVLQVIRVILLVPLFVLLALPVVGLLVEPFLAWRRNR